MVRLHGIQSSIENTSQADLLERPLDKGIVTASDIKIRLVEVELITRETPGPVGVRRVQARSRLILLIRARAGCTLEF